MQFFTIAILIVVVELTNGQSNCTEGHVSQDGVCKIALGEPCPAPPTTTEVTTVDTTTAPAGNGDATTAPQTTATTGTIQPTTTTPATTSGTTTGSTPTTAQAKTMERKRRNVEADCVNDAECINNGTHFICSCNDGFTERNDGTCKITDTNGDGNDDASSLRPAMAIVLIISIFLTLNIN